MQMFALDKLKDWIHHSGRASKQPGPSKRKGVAKIAPIEALGLPPPKRMSVRDFAIYLLQAGAEIEHSLLVQYLYAAYSVDERADSDTSNIGLQWKTHIRLVAREEMTHLATVQNLLLSLKTGQIYLDRGPISKNVQTLPLPFQLEPLSQRSLGKYVLFESPAHSLLPPEAFELVRSIEKSLGSESRVLSVGSIYAALYWVFLQSDDPGDDWPFAPENVAEFLGTYGTGYHLKDSDFTDIAAYRERAAEPDEWGVYEQETHVDSASPRGTALASLRWIMAQGEGPNVIEESHFYRFVEMYQKFKELGQKSPILPVPTNPQVHSSTHGPIIKNKVSKLWAELGNSRYQLLILNIYESLNSKRTTATNQRNLFAKWAIAEMELLKKIGQMLPRMFLVRSPEKTAGAVFKEVVLSRTQSGRDLCRQQLLNDSDAWISEIDKLLNPKPTVRKPKKAGLKVPLHTEDPTTAGLEGSLLDAVARQNDEMRDALRQLEAC